MPREEKNRIEDLKQSLYSRSAPDVRARREPHFLPDDANLKKDWEHPKEIYEGLDEAGSHHDKKMSIFTKLLIGSAMFCILAVGAGTYIFYNGGNFISGDNIEISINGPTSVPGGMPITLSITITNKNSVALNGANLNVHFPAGTTDPVDTTSTLDDLRSLLGDIAPGESVTKSVSAVMFGEQNTQKEIKASVSYGIAGSSSTFTKESSYDVLINSAPVILTLSSLKETVSGQPFDLVVNIRSDSPNTLKNILLKATYPPGFSFISASIKPSSDDNTVWSIGDIPPGGSRNIVVHGSLSGEDTESKVFHFVVGARGVSGSQNIGTVLMETENDILITKPFVSLKVLVNNDSLTSDYVGYFGKTLNLSLKWTNNLPEPIANMVITAHIAGTAYDKNNINVSSGYFRSSTDDVIWNPQTNSEFSSVAAGSGGIVSFRVTPSQLGASTNHVVNPVIVVSATASGDRIGQTNVPVNTAAITRNVRISSNLSLSGRIVRTIGSILNSGPIPPVAEQKTTYTVIWAVDNTSNLVSDAVVTAILPPYVSWTGTVSPSTEDVSYDKNNGTITWNIGNVNSFTTGTDQRREVEFQVSLEPSVDQVGNAPVLINQAVLTGVDNWTRSVLRSTQGYLTTSFSTDPSFRSGDGDVVNKL